MENLVGRKVKGFKFENSSYLPYGLYMDEYIGEVAEVTGSGSDYFNVRFEDGEEFAYPLDQIQAHLVDEWEVGKEYEFSNNGNFWTEPKKLLAIIDYEFKYVVEARSFIDGYKEIREIQPQSKELTIAEAEEKLSELLNETIKIK